ncbi:YeiH family protein [Paenibacillus sp. YN15]|uniref:YeiH family protein n=1 Tax=Paenibacillus sp. YN15 TaxID=1742774 RepID=UPI000DCE6E24|nr:putative sulfate exporter family transporter [Paenibacillus sp. YN15]RAV03582.1 putative sulfate exporter family transporter [Paenibacillus sp. YN15]
MIKASEQGFRLLKGILFTFIIALAGYILGKIPGLGHLGPMAWAILLAVLYRQVRGYPVQLRPGIQFSSTVLLRLAIILFGLKLNIAMVLEQGPGLLIRDAAVILFALAATLLLARLFRADPSLSLLLAIGTGVCGAAAVAAVSPILKTKEEDTAMAVGMIALVGTIFAIGYTLALPYLPLAPEAYGIWAGCTLHEIAHVALAAAPAGNSALAAAFLAKLGRVLLLMPLSFILLAIQKRFRKGQEAAGTADSNAKIKFPWFLAGFIGMSILNSYVLGRFIAVPAPVMEHVSTLTSFLLTMAMAGLGLNVHLKKLRTKALRPLLAMTITSVLLSAFGFITL